MSKSILGALSNKGAPSERFFGEVVSYADDLSSMIVKTLGSGETRTVTMNSDKIAVADGQARPDVSSFAGRGKLHTEVGGTVLVEDAKRQADGSWAARWLSAAVRRPGEGAVIEGVARVGPIKTGANDKPYRAVDVLAQNETVRIETAGELREALDRAMSAHGAAVIRIAEFHERGNYGIKTVFANGGGGDQPMETALANNESLRNLLAATGDGGLDGKTTAIEVVPCKRFFFGSDAGQAARLDTLFTKEGDNGRFSKGFGHTLLVLRASPEDGYQFAVKAMTKSYQTSFTRGGPFSTEGGQAIESKVKAAWQEGRDAVHDKPAPDAQPEPDPADDDFDLGQPPAAASMAAAPAMG